MAQWVRRSDRNLSGRRSGVRSHHLAYVIYTLARPVSPRVAIEHRNTVNFICWAEEAFTGAAAAGGRCSAPLLSFDLAGVRVGCRLSRGLAVHLVSVPTASVATCSIADQMHR